MKTNSEDELKWFFDQLDSKQPFAFARFNDGEMGGIMEEGFIAARGDQKIDASLRGALIDALLFKSPYYFVGIPCRQCFPEHYNACMNLVGSDEKNQKLAVNLTNRNWQFFVESISKHLIERNVVWLGGDDQETKNLPFAVVKQFRVPRQNSWAHIDEIQSYIDEIAEDAVVFISLGPTARVLAHQWHIQRPDLTLIDIGSTFDPHTRNVRHKCHLGWEESGFNKVPRCKTCN